MIDFSTLQGLTIPEGVVTQITDASGRVIWAVSGGKVILEVEKHTSNTYAAETTYENEQFILLDIYPKTNGTVSVTYGGLTKTITDTSGEAEPNAQQVFFGTFNGVSDEVATPASGELTIEGDFYGFTSGYYSLSKVIPTATYRGVLEIRSFGGLTDLTNTQFSNCYKLTNVNVPNGVTAMSNLFPYCVRLQTVMFPASLKTISSNPFMGCNIANPLIVNASNPMYKVDSNALIEIPTKKLVSFFTNSSMPSDITEIGDRAFQGLTNLTEITIPDTVVAVGMLPFGECTSLASVTVLATTPPTVNIATFTIFYGCDALVSITVPKGCGEAYKTAEGWSTYADIITEVS